MRQVAVMGSGSWGTAFAMILADAGCQVRLWGRRPELAASIEEHRINPDYLPGVRLPDEIRATSDPGIALDGAEVVVLAIPSQRLRETLARWGAAIPARAVVVSLAKGIELGTKLRMSQVIEESAGVAPDRIVVVTGPNLSHEIAARQPAAAVVASVNRSAAAQVAECVASPSFRPYTDTDVIGCELGGATKNVVAVAVGTAAGLGFGDNTRATLITRGLAETVRLGTVLGAEPQTFQGLAGVGDLIATCMSPLSRNHSVGVALGQGHSLEEIVAATRQTAEGVKSCESILALAQDHGVELPLVEAVVAVVHDGHHPALVARALMARELKAEKI
ncbi:glycerol 3-phosphate dehydrogenase (NAD(P)+) [Austwickia chelonae]|uniref:Glycerol-3-phosphate dehydrogenase [NAD(P)+] n=1 Tax=Austwickia chelonae NBRC 105200 TaxID=1184607 RepID=K6VIP4_9MICO|nr:NAD(P)H-dependent glycerol-3-phosphate dehydrogenase [Austwickia chelonae]GAB76599.1 NAD(P)H-dependent glycerol-3-phosphate dehydrogenase [Austwickia chelonae NBRC 105200]SEW27720.1 glycerol 3-phosphate dehydrogenase (NAD(P)+) [Austwickia chelonae]